MSRLPILSGREIIKALNKLGYREVRQRGSHIRLSCQNRRSVTVPNYQAVSRGLLRKILRDAELSPEEFLKLCLTPGVKHRDKHRDFSRQSGQSGSHAIWRLDIRNLPLPLLWKYAS